MKREKYGWIVLGRNVSAGIDLAIGRGGHYLGSVFVPPTAQTALGWIGIDQAGAVQHVFCSRDQALAVLHHHRSIGSVSNIRLVRVELHAEAK